MPSALETSDHRLQRKLKHRTETKHGLFCGPLAQNFLWSAKTTNEVSRTIASFEDGPGNHRPEVNNSRACLEESGHVPPRDPGARGWLLAPSSAHHCRQAATDAEQACRFRHHSDVIECHVARGPSEGIVHGDKLHIITGCRRRYESH